MTTTALPEVERQRFAVGRVLRVLVVNPGALIGAIILTALVVGAIFAPLLAPFELYVTDTGPRLSPPTANNLLGTDLHGRDIFSRVLYGGRFSLSVGIATVLFAAVLGSFFGVFIGFVGGRVDAVGSR
ncbi:MAG: ABC transporter permease, partial [bacterium]|nr:ABC transporter permease [bacterium]